MTSQLGMFDDLNATAREPKPMEMPKRAAVNPPKQATVAATLRDLCFNTIANHTLIPYYSGLTADEVAGVLRVDILAVRPRITELHNAGLIEQTEVKRPSSRGNASKVWRTVKR